MSVQLGLKSSSGLFPAVLVEAELKQDYVEDVYLLKPGNSLDKTAQFAVTHLSRPASRSAGLPPVVMLHGLYRNRQQWVGGGRGLAMALLNAGYDIWLPEMREHGSSPVGPVQAGNGPLEIAECDLPAAALFIREQTQQPAVWLGVDVGSLALLYGLQRGLLSDNVVRHFISLGGPCDSRAISLGQRIADAGLQRKLLQEPGGEEHERRDWVKRWRDRFDLLSRWRARPTQSLAAYLAGPELRMLILAPECFSNRLSRWSGLAGVQIEYLAHTGKEYAAARHWLDNDADAGLLQTALLHALAGLTEKSP